MIYERLDEIVNGETSTRAIRSFKEVRSKERKERRRLKKLSKSMGSSDDNSSDNNKDSDAS
jgi:hypothetical protein